MGLALGLCLPNLHWVSEAAVVKRSAASMLAMFGGWLLAGGVLFLPLTLLDYAVPPLAAQAVLSGCAAGAGPTAAPLAVHPRRSPVCHPALKWDELECPPLCFGHIQRKII